MADLSINSFMSRYADEGLTFDDVSLCIQYADFTPEETSIKSKFSRNIDLNNPFVSAAMDTVTESEMAIAMALAGGIGVIHRNITSERQADEVRRVKGYLNGLIEEPVVFRKGMWVSELLAEKERKKYNFSGFPIVDKSGRLCGIITSRDIKFLREFEVPVEKAMTVNLITSPVGTTLVDAFEKMLEHKVGKLPIVDGEGQLAGLYSFYDVKSLIENNQPEINRDKFHKLRVAAAVGPDDYERVEKLAEAGVDALVIDTAHGHTQNVIDTVRYLKKHYPTVDTVAGNIGSKEAAIDLLNAGADALKVGIGPGSICTTRVVTGVGIPQLTAIHAVCKAVMNEIPVIADGGIRNSGDVPKAIAVGGSSVMMGSALAGTRESPGEKILHQGRTYVVYRGMGSLQAMKVGKGSRDRYGQADIIDSEKLVPQGIEGLVQFRGSVTNILTQYIGGLKFALGYCGSRTLEELQVKAQFVRVSYAGLREGHAHDIKVLKDAPNYSSSV